jgi:hypothetical protein
LDVRAGSASSVPVAAGGCADADRVKGDAFPAMSAGLRPHRGLRLARDRLPTLREAADVFLAQPDLAASSRRPYAQTLGRLGRDLGPERLWSGFAAGSSSGPWWRRGWPRGGDVESPRGHRALVLGLLRARRLVVEPFAEALARRREPADRTRAIP